MKIYLDTSALVKLVVTEVGSDALAAYLRQHRGDIRFTSALARAELVRAVARAGSSGAGIAHARRLLGRLDTVTLNTKLLDTAATLPPPELRTLDAIHVASARTAAEDLRALVTYDARMASTATELGITVAQPA